MASHAHVNSYPTRRPTLYKPSSTPYALNQTALHTRRKTGVARQFALALFAYKRTDHLAMCIESLLKQDSLELYDIHVFLDGPAPGDDLKRIEKTRQIATEQLANMGARFYPQESNRGLSQSIIQGLNELRKNYQAFVVIEDDLLLSAGFLRFMTDGLTRFAGHPKLACIHGYALPIADLPPLYFLRGGDCWGWATWSEKWSLFRSDTASLLEEMRIKGLLDSFDLSTGPSQTGLLLDTALGRRDSWAIRWHASLYLADQLTLHPGESLVFNTGNDSSGTHARHTQKFDSKISNTAPDVSLAPEVRHDEESARKIREHFEQQRRLPQALHRAALRLRYHRWHRSKLTSADG